MKRNRSEIFCSPLSLLLALLLLFYLPFRCMFRLSYLEFVIKREAMKTSAGKSYAAYTLKKSRFLIKPIPKRFPNDRKLFFPSQNSQGFSCRFSEFIGAFEPLGHFASHFLRIPFFECRESYRIA